MNPVAIEIPAPEGPLTVTGWSSEPDGMRPDVIWLHANGFNAKTYRHTLAPLSPRLKVLAVDQRGHGGTAQVTPAEGRRDALDLRDDLLALIKAVSPDRPVILAGHSLGGCVALLAAPEAPRSVRALALFEPVVLSREVSARALGGDGSVASESPLVGKARGRRRHFASREEVFESYRGRAIFAHWPRDALRDYVDAGFKDAPGGGVELACAPEWEAAIFAAHAHDIWSAMARITAPVRIFRGEPGSTCAIARADEFPRPAGQVEVTTVPGGTHFLPIERPDVVRQAILDAAAL